MNQIKEQYKSFMPLKHVQSIKPIEHVKKIKPGPQPAPKPKKAEQV